MSKSRQWIIGILTIIILIAIIFGVRAIILANNNSNNESKNNNDKSAPTVTLPDNVDPDQPNSPLPNTLNEYVGTYQGVGQILSNSFIFQKSSITFNNDATFTLEAEGFDLQNTQNQQFVINNTYPVGYIKGSGKTYLNDDGTINLVFSTFVLSFLNNGTVIDESQNRTIVGILSTNLGVQVPTASEFSPLTINTIFLATQSGDLNILNKPGVTNQVYLNLSTKRV